MLFDSLGGVNSTRNKGQIFENSTRPKPALQEARRKFKLESYKNFDNLSVAYEEVMVQSKIQRCIHTAVVKLMIT